ncbi:GNAT family N-acetyltransferase [Tepidibacter aestuarii]|uniref:GNAT family N-acetyltransferase n=1 Tax=Tepidibacter aestuarii TaxID=2925782 RepID=UPI0020C138F9|nr:GNAT family N-acetyltransferase [Tepidibacter aestuarii]CAH2211755.1 N-acetyltransferase domain-containing protein [Tepidibacter aestuarii]
MINVHEINNFNSLCETYNKDELTIKIADLVNANMLYENKGNTYSKDEMQGLGKNKTAESIKELIDRAYLVYLTNEKNEIIGCGMVIKQDNLYFAKTLHIRHDYRGFGYAQKICDLRENFLRSIGEKEIYIESLKYPKTIEFHKKRGFKECPNYRELKYTILMKKDL